jgi:hypothetical protein
MRYRPQCHGTGSASFKAQFQQRKKEMVRKWGAYSYITILTALFNKLSPKIMVYSFGSTLYWLKIVRMVTGSVADRVEPKIRHSINGNLSVSSPRYE